MSRCSCREKHNPHQKTHLLLRGLPLHSFFFYCILFEFGMERFSFSFFFFVCGILLYIRFFLIELDHFSLWDICFS